MISSSVLSSEFSETQVPLSFAVCQAKACAEVTVEDDGIAERDEFFSVILERSDTLDNRIEVSPFAAYLAIVMDNDREWLSLITLLKLIAKQCLTARNSFSAMVVGFTSTTFTGTETAGHATVCVEVLNPPSGGAVRPFSITMTPQEGSSMAYSNVESRYFFCNHGFFL